MTEVIRGAGDWALAAYLEGLGGAVLMHARWWGRVCLCECVHACVCVHMCKHASV